MKCISLIIFLGLLPIVISNTTYRNLHLPRTFGHCLKKKYFSRNNFVDEEVGYNTQFNCWTKYKWTSKIGSKSSNAATQILKKSVKGMRYINDIKKRVAHQNRRNRGKRQAFEIRRRVEYRMMSDYQRMLFNRAILKMKTRIIDNETNLTAYDAFAAYHSGDTQFTAHGGCNFLGWHRIYLLMFEEACLFEEPELEGIPYWDSSLDFYMPDPSRSIMWHPDFAGNGDGEVVTGTFGGPTPVGPLVRNVGRSGSLYSREDIHNVTSRTRMSEICGGQAPPFYDAEFKHGPIHIFVDGLMGVIETAAHDPVFFMHHCFVDLLWEEFRLNSERSGVDINSDYPSDFGDFFHAPDVILDLEPSLYVEDAIHRRFSEGYVYADRPTCGPPSYTCGSPYLRCVSFERFDHCMPIEIDDDPHSTTTTSTTTTTTTTTTPRPTTPRPTTPRPTTPRPTIPTTPRPGNCTKYLPPRKKDYRRRIKPRQNTFCADGISDANQWIYIPARITLSRPYDVQTYGSYPVVNGKVQKRSDIYAPSDYGSARQYLKPGRPKAYPGCSTDESGVGEIYIQSDGINYDGNFAEFALVDTRLTISMSIAYIAVKKPSRQIPTDVLLTGYDHCGRICHPSCLNVETGRYVPCTGAIRIYDNSPTMYGNHTSDSVMNVWDVESDTQCPQYRTDKIHVSFFCDYSNRWPWPTVLSQKDPPTQKLPQKYRRPQANLSQPTPLREPPQSQICQPPRGGRICRIKRTRCNDPCEDGEKFACISNCRMYAVCHLNSISVVHCRRGNFNPVTKQCELHYTCRRNLPWNYRNRFRGK